MITINFFKDGAYVKGHDINEICAVVSYAMWSCINDCRLEDERLHYYESINDDKQSTLGLTYIKIHTDIAEHAKIFSRFKEKITCWVETMYPNRVKVVDKSNELINWHDAMMDALKTRSE